MSKNMKYEATGTLFIDKDNNLPEEEQYVTFGLQSLKVTNIHTKQTYELPDKFYVTSTDLRTSRQEFFQRWVIYIQSKFHVNYIPISINQ